ncbi:MAG: PKD domain-containing protein [Acidobacteriota bacterium]
MKVSTASSRLALRHGAGLVLAILALVALPARLEGQGCSVLSPTDFEPNPPGPARPSSLSAAYNSNLSLYRAGAGGPWRLLLQESFGYSVLDLSNPANPTVIRWDDLRYDASTPDSNPIPQHGDGQSYIQTVAVSPDGVRAAFSVSGPGEPDWHTMVGRADPNNGFGIWGDFGNSRASGTVVQQVGSRYIAYSTLGTAAASAADVTTLPTALGSLNLSYETTNWPAGTGLGLAGGFLYYIAGSAVQVIDATTPGPVGSITAAYKTLQITSAMVPDFGGRTPQYVAGAVDPANSNKLWLLVALAPIIGQENSPSYGLVSVTRDGGPLPAPVSAGPAYRIPAAQNETWVNAGPASSLVLKNGTLYALMWSNRRAPSYRFGMFSTTVGAWATASTTASQSLVTNPNFSVGSAMGFIDGPGNTLYGYAASGDAWVVPFSCASPDTPASSSLTVVNASAGGAAVADGGTVFVGDQLTIVPSVVPQPSSRPLTSWGFDFDFHAGNGIEDAGTSPRIKNPDQSLVTNGAVPPASNTLVGPCDPIAGGVVATGAGCWASVLGNSASGGPDFAAGDPAGTVKPLRIAFEATNSLGISNTAVFTVNWKIPATRVASTQILSGQPLVSASDGHPTGYQWYFGTAPNNLLVAGAPTPCTGPSCVPTSGTSYYWLTATYANGYSTPDYVAGTTAGLPFTVTSFVPVFTVNAASAGPLTAYTYQSLLIQNNSQRGSGITATYKYYLCAAPCTDNDANYVAVGIPDIAGGSISIAVPATPGSYVLRLNANYTGSSSGTAKWPDPVGTPAGFPITVSNAPPPIVVSVNASPNPANHGDTVQLSCSATGGTGTYTAYEWSTTAGTFSSQQNPTFRASNLSNGDVTLPATCTVHDTAGGQGNNTVNVTIHKGATATPISVNAYASPNPANAGNQVTLTCLATGGNGSYSFAWYGPTGGSFSSQQVFTFTASNGSASDVQTTYTCSVSDSAGASGSNIVTHVVRASGPPAPACTAVDYTLKDYLSQQTIVPVGSGQFSAYQVSVGQALQFVPTVSTFSTYSWTFGDGSTSAQQSPQYAYQTGGTRNAVLTASGGLACAVPASYTIIVSGPTGNFSAAYEDATAITYSNVTAFKNIVFTAFDAPGAVDAYSWDFGDATAHATGQTPPPHGFAPGTWTVKLTVTKGTASVNQTLVLTVIPPPEPPRWVVPGMANSTSALTGAHWQSDVTIFNPHPTIPATYSVAFLDATNPYAPLSFKQLVVPPLNTLGSPNLLGDFFGQPNGAYGAFMVRGDVAPLAPVITARTFNNGDPAKGTFGLSVPPASGAGGVSAQASAAASVLIGLRQNAAAYTNIGIVNLKNDSAKVRLNFFDGTSAAFLGTKDVDLAAYQSTQISRALEAAGYAGASDLYTVKVTILAGTAVYPYATVIDLTSTDPVVVTPTDAPSNSYRVPGIIRLTGANGEKWRSRVTLSNPSTTSRKVHMVFSYIACNTNGCSSLNSTQGDVNMTPGQTQQWDDFVKVWLTVKGFIPVDDATSYASSFLDVSPAAGDANQDPVVVLGETYNDTPAGHVGLQIPGYTPLDGANRVGAYKRLALTGLAATAGYRTNLALFAVSGSSARWVGVHVYAPGGGNLRDIPVFVDGFAQVSSATLFGGLSGDLSRLSIVVDNVDDGLTVAGYATIIDNTSGDATFVKATPVP